MNITVKDTNVIVLFGDGAVSRFSDMVNNWTQMISSTQWSRIHFVLAASETPKLDLEEPGRSLVNGKNTHFFRLEGSDQGAAEDPPPDPSTYHDMIYDQLESGEVKLHIICDAGGKSIDYEWIKGLIRSALAVEVLSTTCLYYLMFGRHSMEKERTDIISMLNELPGAAILVGDSNEHGGRIVQDERVQAVELAVLMNCAGELPISRGAYSLGYSALNASGSELRRVSESSACRALYDELEKPIVSFSEADTQLKLLPEGMSSLAGARTWLEQYVRDHAPQMNATAVRNAWITIRMDMDMPSTEAIRRMKRFADLNYTGVRNVGQEAQELAWQTSRILMQRLRENAVTARLSDRVLNEIAEAFRQIAAEDVQPSGCTYPRKPLSLKLKFGGGADEYLRQCRETVLKPIRTYITEKNVTLFAAELVKVYEKAAEWVRGVRGEDDRFFRRETALQLLADIQKELDAGDAGDAVRLAQKYKNYATELMNLHPTLSVLTDGAVGVFFNEDGSVSEKDWRALVRKAGKNVEKRLSSGFRGDFFKVLKTEFATVEDREKFFNTYLQSGPGMYRNMKAQKSTGTSVLLADDRLTDQWFSEKTIYEVHTDNAENLTLYPLGNMDTVEYLQDQTVYFKGNNRGSAGNGGGLFDAIPVSSKRPNPTTALPDNPLFGGTQQTGKNDEAGSPGESIGNASLNGLRLEPDDKNAYRLYWDWNGSDATAMVEIYQHGEKVGKVSVIPVKRFVANGYNMNVTDDVMDGKPLPAGTLTVTIRNERNEVFIGPVDLQGRRDVIRYRVNNRQLQLKPDNSSSVDKVVLRTTDTDGQDTYYPLYRSQDEKPWLYSGMSLSDGRIVEDPDKDGGQVFAVLVDD